VLRHRDEHHPLLLQLQVCGPAVLMRV
jgi:hypothetical protein